MPEPRCIPINPVRHERTRARTYLLALALPGCAFSLGSSCLSLGSAQRRRDGRDDGRLDHPLQVRGAGDGRDRGNERTRRLGVRARALRTRLPRVIRYTMRFHQLVRVCARAFNVTLSCIRLFHFACMTRSPNTLERLKIGIC